MRNSTLILMIYIRSLRLVNRAFLHTCIRPRARFYCSMFVHSEITPNERESKLFKTLTSTLEHSNLDTTLRCAGGWVRDKLLGLESDDIDIAIDNMLGKDFAEHVNRYLESQNMDTHKVAVIMSNPEQSKHLETARMRLDGLELDLVNLRSETYTDSRIPEMAFGTPTQDAERRDFTVNSLFYNLNTKQVEDFTGRGLDDLRAGIIRTPLPASQTFLDDPLRVLRALRFAARFGFALDAALQEAAATPAVREALGKKVSRERMGVELEKMFAGKGAVRAAEDLELLRLLPAIFPFPESAGASIESTYGASGVELTRVAAQLLEDWEPQGEAWSKEERRLGLMAALLLPLAACRVPLKGNRSQPLTSHLLLAGIKWRMSDAACLECVHNEAAKLLAAFWQLQGTKSAPDAVSDDVRVSLGRSLQALKGNRWRIGLLLAPLTAMREAAPLGVDPADVAEKLAPNSGLASTMESREARAECCRQLEAAIYALELNGCWDWKPLLDGKEIMKKFNVKGATVGKLKDQLTDFQLAHPRATLEEARSFLASLQA